MYKKFTQFFCTPPGCRQRILLIMKLTTILLIGTFLQVSAASFAQNITYSHKSASLEQIFKAIRKQTGYNVLWSSDKLKNIPAQDVDFKDAPIDQVLDKVLAGKPLTYQIENKTILIKDRQISAPPLPNEKPSATLIDVHGQVVDESGQPLAGATVKNKLTNKSTMTDAKGYFALKSIDNEVTLVISYIGYQNLEIKPAGELGVITLKIANNQLDAVHVIAYGQTSKRLTVGNIASLSAKEIEAQPVNNPLLALEGRVPGLFIVQNTGVPGGQITAHIQGQNSIANGSDPFYVIDGVPFYSQFPNSGTGNSILKDASSPSNAAANPLNFLNPADIESIEILKDANATAIYGSRAANGAVLITTKKGKPGKTKLNLNLQDGIGQLSHEMPELSTQQYLSIRNQAFKNDGLTPSSTAYDLTSYDQNRYTNWQHALLGNAASYLNTYASVGGGSANIQYLIAGGFHRETTVFPLPSDFADQKASLHFSLNSISTDNKFKMMFSGNYVYDENRLPQVDLTNTALSLVPNAPSIYSPDGTLNWYSNSSGASMFSNPLTALYKTYDGKTSNLISNLQLSYKILPGLDVSSSFGYTNTTENEFAPTPLVSFRPELRTNSQNSAIYAATNLNSWIVEPQANFKHQMGRSLISLLVGGTLSANNSSGNRINGHGYPTDQVLEDMSAASSVVVENVIESKYKYLGFFGRLNYNFNEELIVDLNLRRDASSRFGPANQFHNFGSIGGAWIFSNEKIFSNNSWLSFGKLRTSYGVTGNDQIGDYNFLSLYAPTYNGGVPYQGITGYFPYQLSNPYLQWEITKKLQFGIDLGFFKDKILLDASYSRNRSSNQLLSYTEPSITGFTSILANFPATVQNSSFEFSASSENIRQEDFSWKTRINLTIPNNKLVAFPNLAGSPYANILAVGQPLSVQKVFHYTGVDPSTGQFKFQSTTDPLNPVYPDDATSLVNTLPKFYGGFENNFTYKRFQLDFLFQVVKQIGPNYAFGLPNQATIGSFLRGLGNQPASVLNFPVKKYSTQFFDQNITNAQNSDAAFGDASYIRLKNLSLSYELPAKWIQARHLQNLRISIQGQNLLTFTKFRGIDPENTTVWSLPPLRVITLGLQIGL
jgi:TonB-linked SusC/RagA family outer membrane protein